MLTTYHTIAESGVTEIVIKGSRFICSLKRVHSEDEAKGFIQAVKKEHWESDAQLFCLPDRRPERNPARP